MLGACMMCAAFTASSLARLTVLDWLAPMPETPTDRAIREEGERLRKASPWLDERQR